MDSTVKKMLPYDVLAIGEINADLVMEGLASVPETGKELMCRGSKLMLGSSTAICACVMASLGLRTGFLGKLGTDPFGVVCENYMRRYGIDMKYVIKDDSIRTGLTVSLSCGSDRALVTDCADTVDCLREEDLPEKPWEEARHIHIGSYFLQPRFAALLPPFLKKVKAHGMTVSLDAGWQEEQNWDNGLKDTLPYVDIFFPNESEVCGIGRSSNVEEAAERVHAMMNGGLLVVKCGADGAMAVTKDSVLRCPGFSSEVVDTTGAGDSFNAGFLYAWLNGKELETCLRYGNAVGAESVRHSGGTEHCPTLEEAEKRLAE